MSGVSMADAEARADALVRGAHARAYRYPEGFSGFRAEVVASCEGRESVGEVVARPGPEIELTMSEAESVDAQWVERELRSIIGHRQPLAYERSDGRHAKRVVEDTGHPLGVLVELDDEYSSAYRLFDGAVASVSRTLGERRFTIVVHERRETGDGTAVPTSFTVFYWAVGGDALTATEAYRDTVVDVEGVLLPRSRVIVREDADGLSVRRLSLREHAIEAAG
jgi:hypothetical protein